MKKTPTVTLEFEEVQFALGPYLALEATVTGENGPIKGLVTFQADGDVLGNSNLDETGKASLRYSGIKPGVVRLFVVFAGNDEYEYTISEKHDFRSSKPKQVKPPFSSVQPSKQKTATVIPRPEAASVTLEVDLHSGVKATPLPDSRENIEYLIKNRTVNMAGVGINLKHGHRFVVTREEHLRLMQTYGDFLKVVKTP